MSALDWLMQQLGSERQDTSTPGDQVVRQDASGNFVPYKPPSGADALQMLYEMTGVPGMQSAQAAWDRGEYLPAIGQEAASVGQLASSVLPVARGLGAAGKFAAPAAREMAASVPDLLADEAGALKLPGGGPIRAYHGSPHDFDRFDLSKIGTGEGAQAYGHGLYFAESEPVATAYADQLARTKVGQALSPSRTALPAGVEEHAAAIVRDARRDGAFRPNDPNSGWDAAIKNAREWARDPAVVAQIEAWKREAAPIETQRHMYEVDLHTNPASLLDFDASMREQAPAVMEALRRGGAAESALSAEMRAGPYIKEAVQQPYRASDLFNRGGAPLDVGPTDIARRLNDAGIPGVKYLDQGSRSAGAGSSNYVMFDDRLIEILRKYGLAGLTAGTGAAAFGGSADAAPADALDRIKRQLGG